MKLKTAPSLQWKNGYAQLVFYEPWREKPYKWRSLRTKDKKEADRRRAMITAQYLAGEYSPWGDVKQEPVYSTLQNAVDEFLSHKGATLKGTSMHSLREVLEPFKELYGGSEWRRSEVLVKDITPKEIMRYAQGEGLSNQTIKRRLVTMKSLFRWHMKMGEEINEGILDLKPPRVPGRLPRFMSEEERDIIFEAMMAKDLFMLSVWELGYSTGLRPVDMCRLKWENVKEDYIEVQVSKYDAHIIPRFQRTNKALVALTNSSEYVLGRRYLPSSLSSRFGEIVRDLPIPRITLYEATRHTFASWLVQRGVSILQVGKWMGHKDVSTTMRYAHLNPDDVPPQAYEVFR